MFTFVLAYIVLSVATVTPPQQRTTQNFQFALCIGSCVTVGGFAIGSISGGSLNPAVSWGLSTAGVGGKHLPWYNCILYTCFELLGGALAALVFSQTHVKELEKNSTTKSETP